MPMRPILVKWGKFRLQIPTEVVIYLLLRALSHL